MYVCICHAVTEKQIKQAVTDGMDSMRDVRGCLGVGSQCGKCVCHAKDVITQSQQELAIKVSVDYTSCQKVA
ncbi:MAG: bacterioferritin-associated ferredoxin [Pseudoalteromonas spongiae]|jgi:bacterioferritin-associated ferredoxin|uniref:Bacterioferritin-associated ferredoxin n=2 Tax=Pseudoalteromonas TaxID=53246 RepID=A0A0A7ECM5_9GAMM|nr:MULTISPECIES: bacterioferritin-associated ferredoxin [Pseudoalteromonas]MEC8326339.1 bacterioferritin-associated ferredoxin [Pseudomonadota bacterium]AIY63787.1 (2Fe-2S)-binding protein [Pseudoalteromonas piratica]ATC99511.1 bacterioferritin-associated ferredoxin [Pseudoalteromonas spongiae UST010723-006]MCF6458107.1 bacterioferritin-associated ferredoxin [Pseudoalteromonas sp. MMG024]MDE3272644.1 bacterioferritin-associated ferredoxin [Pseudoalteromonas sp. G4]|tara:strand:+ start:283 stop:498 length:216 start_codon:yes stop_codon:yes gene_type:complete